MRELVSSGGIIIKNNKILLVSHGSFGWSFPKGKLKRNETIINACKREIKEETGLKRFKINKKLGIIKRGAIEKGTEKVKKSIHLYLITTEDKKLKDTCRWFTLEKASRILAHKEDRKFLIRTKHQLKPFFTTKIKKTKIGTNIKKAKTNLLKARDHKNRTKNKNKII